jgi:hypothetical protein
MASWLTTLAAWLTSLALRLPRTTLAILVLSAALAGLGATRLRSANFFEGHLPRDDRELGEFRRLVDEFGGDQFIVLGLGCGVSRACADVFSPEMLGTVRAVSELALAVPGVMEVRSLTSAGVLAGKDGTLRLERLGDLRDPVELARFRASVERDPILLGTLVSRDLRTTALVVRFDPSVDDDERNGVVLHMRDALEAVAREAGFELQSTGYVMRVAAADAYVRDDLARLTPAMVALLALLLVWVFWDATSVVLALATVAIPTIWAFGLMCWIGRPITPIVSTMPILILVVGITDAVHFLVRVHDLRASVASLHEVVLRVAREVGAPTTVTAFAAALGFLSFLAARIPNLRDFGVFASVGILGAWLTTFTLIPAALACFGVRARPRPSAAFALADRALEVLRGFARRRAWLVLGTAAVGLAISLLGLARLVPDNDTLKLLGEGDPLVRAEHFLRERLRPLDTLEVLYEPPEGESVTEPEALSRLVRAEAILEERMGARPVLSLLPVLRVAHRELVDGSLRVPTGGAQAGQLLLLAEAADADGVASVVTPDRRLARLSAGYPWGGSDAIREDLRVLRERLGALLGDAGTWSLTGSIVLSAHVADLILEGQIASFSTAFLTIFAILFLFLRSIPLGVLGMIPNVLPVAAILGYMGWTGTNLDVGTAMIASILLGVSVDDTVYFLLHYQRARRGGATVRDAVAYTFSVAGKPAIFCGSIIALGFFVLGFSSFQSLAIFGLLSGVAVLLAGATELFLMPALLEVTAGRRERG